MERVCQYLKDAGTYFIATVDGDRPRVRPFGTAHIIDGKLCIQTGRSKDFFKQLEKNPKCEICACQGGTWLRVAATLCEDPRIETQEAMLEAYPSLRAMYAPGDGNTAVLYLKDAEATFSSFTAPAEVERF